MRTLSPTPGRHEDREEGGGGEGLPMSLAPLTPKYSPGVGVRARLRLACHTWRSRWVHGVEGEGHKEEAGGRRHVVDDRGALRRG